MMSCGTSSRYGSSLLLKNADFSIQGDLLIQKSCSEVLELHAMRRQLPLRTGEGVVMEDYFAVFSNVRSMTLPRVTAASSASLAVFWPASAASNSSAQMSRICTMLPKRRPREFSVGSLLVSSLRGVCRIGFFS